MSIKFNVQEIGNPQDASAPMRRTVPPSGEKHIVDLEYAPNQHDGDGDVDKRVIFDLHCRGDNGEYFIMKGNFSKNLNGDNYKLSPINDL